MKFLVQFFYAIFVSMRFSSQGLTMLLLWDVVVFCLAAVACAEVGIKAHLLLRGERPAIPTGYNLVSGMYGHVTYIPRAEYADRQAMLQKHAVRVAGDPTCIISMQDHMISSKPGNSGGGDNKKRVVILNEGAGDCFAVLGLEPKLTSTAFCDICGGLLGFQ